MNIIYIVKKKIEPSKDCIGKFIAVDATSLNTEFSFVIKNDSGLKLVFDSPEDKEVFEKNIILGSDCVIAPLNIIFSNKYEEISSYIATIIPNLIKKYLEDKKAHNAQS